ncbi:MAG: DmsC/YnfH family molybdoenzyme membrane anchor subunit [Pseudomonadota bacterium]
MHPAPSLIVFTALSGFGFGLMAWLGVLGSLPPERFAALAVLALAAAGAGLLASVAHLGNPQRAWRAFSQWQSSWLSREGLAALAAMAVFFVHAGLAYLGRPLPGLGWLASGLALVTILCTAMIYAQLKTVPRWHTRLTPLLFALFALSSAAIAIAPGWAAIPLLAATGLVQWRHWAAGDVGLAASAVDAASATGLSGQIRVLAHPHTGPNYLLDEMVFRFARKRAEALRRLVMIGGILLPALLLLAFMAFDPPAALLAVPLGLHLTGTALSRWLFFAEATHTVSLYYGRA